ncbi:hypothetical protein [Puia dinghuensis]|uniref:TerB family tellurite resistance protein n=1 Tax=Puia dinghuensis TaxID=1792502 RepID=A0A8J2UB13_9BACT|nr:hypothetical protein [Puia dinghuensis]GGA92356.1 hypothetical protein GCM10011511_14690 [Puia dinghuensis]
MEQTLHNLLNPDQKAAILTVLKWVGLWVAMDVCDGAELGSNSAALLNRTASFLKFDPSSRLLKIYEQEDAEELLFDTLNTIPDVVKPWFVVESYLMLSSEGTITERAMNIALSYFEKFGITQANYLEIVQAAYIATGDS